MQRVSSVGHETNHTGLMIENVDSLTQGFSGDSEDDSREEDAGSPGGEKRTAEAAGLPGRSENEGGNTDKSKKTTPPNGKKTKGRVKIKMEFIDNKLRRYTTFSKRKTGIMKKAYELSTLTGTQVMLLVASETGHVYTFATRKLQPMITSEAGKALIQTCLNSPDPPAGPGGSGPDQRMSATGFEETELVYSVNEDTENKGVLGCSEKSPDTGVQSGGSSGSSANASLSPPVLTVASSMPGLIPITSLPLLPQSALSSLGTTYTTSSSSSRTTSPTISMQLPQTANFATILAPGGTVPSGTALQLGNLQPTTQNSTSQQTSSSSQTQTVYRIPQGSVASIAGVRTSNSQASSSGASQPTAVTMVPSTQELSVMPGTVMYHAQHGVVYATSASGSLPEIILNLGQSSQTAFTVPQNQASGQQFITIPVPVTLTAAQQQQLFQSFSQNGSSSTVKTTSGANRLHSQQYLTTVKREKDGK